MRISDWSSDVCSSDLSKIAILSGGGDVENAGAITGASGGVYIQGTALDSDDRSGVTGSLANSGAIRGTGDFGGSDGDGRSEERRVGKECVSTWNSRGATYHSKKQKDYYKLKKH